jgi:cysteine-rich repeat protein
LLLPLLGAACAQPDPAVDAPGPACGNGILEAGEECDDGNLGNDDACLVSCYRPVRFVQSDPHVHSRGCRAPFTSPAELLRRLGDQGIELGAALVWGDGYQEDRRMFTGEDDPASGSGRILHYDLEVSAFAAGRSGHLVALGLRNLGFSPDPFRFPKSGLGIPGWAKAQDPRVVVGMAHGQFWPASGFASPPVACCMPWEFPIQVARGSVSFLITERLGAGPPLDPGTWLLWRSLLNAGYRVAVIGGSDFPCIHKTIDATAPRTDAIVTGELDYSAWLGALRQGRVTVALDARNRLNLRVAGTLIGGEVAARAGQVLPVSVESRAPGPVVVEVLINGEPAAVVALPGGSQVATLRLAFEHSAWIAARTARAHTGAVYLVVDGRPIRGSAADACYLAGYARHLSGLVASGAIDLEEDTAEALGAYEAARAEFEARAREAGGGACL